ncbi:MAG: hypothetical protein M3290_04645, partial [Actinomycetota bacterium]|nr:hypothetical protein [Actinomycetota bacterium]
MRLGRTALAITLLVASGLIVSPAQAAAKCGEERWAVKTLSDSHAGDVDFSPRRTTIDHLRHL